MKTKFTIPIAIGMLIAGFLCAQSQTWLWSEDYLSYARSSLSATVMDDSIFYSQGKGPNYSYPGIIDIYDIGDDEWNTYSTQSPGRWFTGAASTNGMVFFAGGCNYDPNNPSWTFFTEVDVFTKETGNWTIKNLSEARQMMGIVAHGNKVFFAGGASANGYHNVIDIYDTETGTWDTAYLSVPRCLIGAAAAGSKVFFAGGCTGSNQVTNVVDIYDTVTGLWEVKYLIEPRAYIAAVAYEGMVYFAGGALPNSLGSATIDIYNVEEESWEDFKTLSGPRIVTAHSVYDALVFTGMFDYFNLNTFTAYDPTGIVNIYYPESDQWDYSVPALNPARYYYGSASYENSIYYAGGSLVGGGQTDIINILDYTPPNPSGIIEGKFQSELEFEVFPNPFTTTLRIDCILQHSGKVKLTIYDIIGKQVEILVNEYQQQGKQEVIFDTEKLKPGIYFCTLKTSDRIQSTKIIKL